MTDAVVLKSGAERPDNKPLPELTLREAEDGDVHFILNSWMKSYEKAKCGDRESRAAEAGSYEVATRAMSSRRYFRGQQALISALAARRRLLVACDAETPEYIVGWACGTLKDDPSELVVDYVYVKHGYRHSGVARELIRGLGWQPGLGIVATHWTKPCTSKAIKYSIEFDDLEISLGAK